MKGTHNVPAVYVIMRRKGKILFTYRKNTGFMDGTYSLPSGHVEANESFYHAGCREALEEVGVTITPADFKLAYTMHRQAARDVRLDLFFEVSRWEGEPFNAEPEKHGDIAWIDEGDLSSYAVMDYQAAVLQAIARGETYSEWGW